MLAALGNGLFQSRLEKALVRGNRYQRPTSEQARSLREGASRDINEVNFGAAFAVIQCGDQLGKLFAVATTQFNQAGWVRQVRDDLCGVLAEHAAFRLGNFVPRQAANSIKQTGTQSIVEVGWIELLGT